MLPSLFISHGSPMLALQPGASGPALKALANAWRDRRRSVVVSAHWESRELLVMGNAQPETWHDFHGFPAALYAVQYPAPGEPALAEQVVERLATAGLPAHLDARRPFDHGAWVPLSLMYPGASIPVIQVSLPSPLGPALQVKVGEALSALRAEGILLVGSGSITHNLGELDWHAGPDAVEPGRWRSAIGWWTSWPQMTAMRCSTIGNRHRLPSATIPVTSTCCRCSSSWGLEGRSRWCTRGLPWGRWGWISIGSTE